MSQEVHSYVPGNTVYEPFLGLCTIVSCERETMLGNQQLFYENRPRNGSAVVKVPATQMATRGIRPLMSPEKIEESLERVRSLQWERTDESYSVRLRRWTRMIRSEQEASGYELLSECRHLLAQGIRLTSQESELQGKIQRTLLQEMAQVLQISLGKATLRLSRVWDPGNKKTEKRSK